jgi:molecular chaperone HtpG
MITEQHETSVDLGGLLSVLGKHLYSTPLVAVRELIQNAHDSITRRRIECPDWHEAGKLQLDGDKLNGVLHITDNGSGLSEQEIHAFLATVGAGYTRTLRTQSDALIGMFGLGFLSAFVIAEQVTVITTSYQQPTHTWRYQSQNGESYSVEAAANDGMVGTRIELKLRNEYRYLASSSSLERLLGHYCALLREPVYCGDVRINEILPPWRQVEGNVLEHPLQQRKRRLAFAARFEEQFEPICTMPVTTSASDLRGILWIQDGATYSSSDNRNLKVFVRGMLLDDDARDLLPRWAGFVGGVIESHDLTPTASREDLQRDVHYQRAQADLLDSLVKGLSDIAATQPAAWRRILARHNEALMAAALCSDGLFALLLDAVRIPTSRGDLSLSELRGHGPVHVSLGDSGGFEDMVCRAMQIPVVKGDRYAVHSFLRRWAQQCGGKLIEIGTEKGNRQLFAEADLPDQQREWLTRHLGNGELLVPARFMPAHLPLVVVPDRDAELKERLESDESDQRIAHSALQLVRQFTSGISGDVKARLYINLENPAIASLLAAYSEQGETTGCRHALTLLRSMKIVMMAGDTSKLPATDGLTGALCDLSQLVQVLTQQATPE